MLYEFDYSDDVNDDQNDINERYGKLSVIMRSKVVKAKEELMKKAMSHVKKASADQIFALKIMNGIPDDIRIKLFEEYLAEWDLNHQDLEKIKKVAKKESTNDKLKRFVIEHMDDDIMDFEQFSKVIKNWNLGKRTRKEWFDEYKKLYFNQPGKTIEIKEEVTNFVNGFKRKKGMDDITNSEVTNHFNLKDNKKYHLHKVSAPDTWIIDLMIVKPLTYLITIEVNTRYCCAEILNEKINDKDEFAKGDVKKTTTYLRALQRMINKGLSIKYLIGDGEGAFNSKLANEYYKDLGIKFYTVERQYENYLPEFMKKVDKKSSPYHTSLALIDRVIRTIRDMAYNMKIGVITPKVMDEILNQYNNAYHSTLTKYAEFKVTPMMVHNDRELEYFIVNRIKSENYNIVHSNGFLIKARVKVKVFNDKKELEKRRSVIRPGEYSIVKFENGKYSIRDEKGKISKVPRFKLMIQ